MPARHDTDDYRALFLHHTPMIDLRAPAEFARGAFPGAASLPLMSDDERAQVGICYKQRGREAAIELGHRLVSGALREERMRGWLEFAALHPRGCLYCWRGGLRSQTVQEWMAAAGVVYPRVVGGYKAMRRFLLQELQRSLAAARLVLVSGRTGSGKTRVIERLARAVDLEGLANHRGSSFGALPTPQPSQIDFENGLSIALLRLLADTDAPLFLEDEGRLIGRLALPQELRERMAAAPLVVVEEDLPARVEVVLQDYVIDLGKRYLERHGEEGPRLHCEKMLADLARIGRRLGGARLQRVQAMMGEAFRAQWSGAGCAGHRQWIAFLLENYYDPMYDYQLERRRGRRLFSGERDAVVAWATRYKDDARTA